MIDRAKLAELRSNSFRMAGIPEYSEMLDTIEKLLAVKEAAEKHMSCHHKNWSSQDNVVKTLAACNEKEGGGR